jgi:hypothetical protein
LRLVFAWTRVLVKSRNQSRTEISQSTLELQSCLHQLHCVKSKRRISPSARKFKARFPCRMTIESRKHFKRKLRGKVRTRLIQERIAVFLILVSSTPASYDPNYTQALQVQERVLGIWDRTPVNRTPRIKSVFVPFNST